MHIWYCMRPRPLNPILSNFNPHLPRSAAVIPALRLHRSVSRAPRSPRSILTSMRPAGSQLRRLTQLVILTGLASATIASPIAPPAAPALAPAPAPTSAPTAQPVPVLSPSVLSALTTLLADALHAPSRQARTQTLLALARLRDPSLQPLFSLLACTGPSEDRADAMIALAALEPALGIDPLLLRQLVSDNQRARVLAASIEQELVSTEQLYEISRWPDLGERSIIIVAAQLAGLGTTEISDKPAPATAQNPPAAPRAKPTQSPATTTNSQTTAGVKSFNSRYVASASVLRKLAMSDDLTTAASAAAVLAQQREASGLTRLSRLTPRLAQPANSAAALEVLDLVSTARLDALGDWCLVLAVQPGVAPDVAQRARAAAARSGSASPAVMESILAVARQAALDPASLTGAGRVQLCLQLLDVAAINPKRLPAPQFAVLANAVKPGEFDALTRAVLKLLALVPAADEKTDDAVVSLLKTLDRQIPGPAQVAIARWATVWSSQQTFQVAQRVRETVISQLLSTNLPDMFEGAIEASRLMIEADPASALPLLSGAGEGRWRATAALLLGALASGNPDSISIAAFALPTIATGDKLADVGLLVQMRHAGPRGLGSDAQQTAVLAGRLAGLAMGEGDFAQVVRMQAAWLAIRASGQERPTLARLLAPTKRP